MAQRTERAETSQGFSITDNKFRITAKLKRIRHAGKTPPEIYAHDPQNPETIVSLQIGREGELQVKIGINVEVVDERHKKLRLTPESIQALESVIGEIEEEEAAREGTPNHLPESFRRIMEPTSRSAQSAINTKQKPDERMDIEQQRELLTEHLARIVLQSREIMCSDGRELRFFTTRAAFERMCKLIAKGNFQLTKVSIEHAGRGGTRTIPTMAGLLTQQILMEAARRVPTTAIQYLRDRPYGLGWIYDPPSTMTDGTVCVFTESYVRENRKK